jgi:hypothetical protein
MSSPSPRVTVSPVSPPVVAGEVDLVSDGATVDLDLHKVGLLLLDGSLADLGIDSIFEKDEMIDVIAVTKGHGFSGVTSRWGTTKVVVTVLTGTGNSPLDVVRVPSTNTGDLAQTLVSTSCNHKVFRIGKGTDEGNASTEFDISKKQITPYVNRPDRHGQQSTGRG